MKRVIALIVALMLLVQLIGCGNAQNDGSDALNGGDNTVDISSQDDTPVLINKNIYVPHSLTVSLYDAQNNVYGFTWNIKGKPLDTCLQVCEGTQFDEEKAEKYSAETESMSNVYICKARATFVPGKTYSYRVYDTKAKVGSDVYTINGRNTSSGSFTFVHLSDSQVNNKTTEASVPLSNILNFVDSRYDNLDFILHTGDVVQNGGSEDDWRNMLEPNIGFLSATPVMAISGNHDSIYGGKAYNTYKHYDVKKPDQNCEGGYYYSFDYSNARFIMLDTNAIGADNKLLADQYNWLVSMLESNTKQWLIVAMHNPMYSVGKYGSDPEKNAVALALKEDLNDLFVQHNVDLVLQGHDHVYSYTYPIGEGNKPIKNTKVEGGCYVNPQGVVYAMHGPAGNQDRAPYSIDSSVYNYAAIGSVSSWAEITINGNKLTVDVLRYNSGAPEVAFSYGIIKQ